MLKIQENISLKGYSTFKIGGRARYFVTVKNVEEIIEAINFVNKKRISFFVLGGGSNILFSDEEYEGIVIKCQMSNVKCQMGNLGIKITCDAGVKLAELVKLSLKKSLTGLEWAAGIPGTVGGAIRGNAGAFGKSMADIVKSVKVLEAKNRKTKFKTFKNRDCEFDYRESIFKKKKDLIIIEAELEFKKESKKEIKKKIKENLHYRCEHQPLNYPSAGSVFKNQKSKIKNQKLIREFPELKNFNKRGEIPVAYLIDKCGLKGKKIGGAKSSEKHANFIVNLRKAKARDAKKLINLIKKKVKEKFGTLLEEEIVIF